MAIVRMMTDRKCRIKGVVNNNQTIVWFSPVRRWTPFNLGVGLSDDSDFVGSRSGLVSAATGGTSSMSRSVLCVDSECCVALDIRLGEPIHLLSAEDLTGSHSLMTSLVLPPPWSGVESQDSRSDITEILFD